MRTSARAGLILFLVLAFSVGTLYAQDRDRTRDRDRDKSCLSFQYEQKPGINPSGDRDRTRDRDKARDRSCTS